MTCVCHMCVCVSLPVSMSVVMVTQSSFIHTFIDHTLIRYIDLQQLIMTSSQLLAVSLLCLNSAVEESTIKFCFSKPDPVHPESTLFNPFGPCAHWNGTIKNKSHQKCVFSTLFLCWRGVSFKNNAGLKGF